LQEGCLGCFPGAFEGSKYTNVSGLQEVCAVGWKAEDVHMVLSSRLNNRQRKVGAVAIENEKNGMCT
jgi:hypothetical protein